MGPEYYNDQGRTTSSPILGGSGDLVSRVITKVTIVISTYNLNWGTYNPTY